METDNNKKQAENTNSTDLCERVKTAADKMENAYEAYKWLVNHESDIDNSKQYTEKFDIFKGLFSVADILLRCFIEEKGIICWKKIGSKEDSQYHAVDVSHMDTKVNLHELCSSILYHNVQKTGPKYLLDVDFACFFGTSKERRNLNEHIGVKGNLQDAYRLFVNLNKILLSLNCNKTRRCVHLFANKETFDFGRFDACMDGMNEDERSYILVADTLHNVESEYLNSFLGIPWSLIIDFDATSRYGGLLSVMDQYQIPYNRFLETDFAAGNRITFLPNRILYVALCDDNDFRERFYPAKKQRKESDLIDAITNTIKNTRTKATIVITGQHTERVGVLIKGIADVFKETSILYLTSQDKLIKLPEPTETEEWDEDGGNITYVNCFDNSIFKVMESMYHNRSNLPVRPDIGSTEGVIYRIQTIGGGCLGIVDRDQIQRLEQFFEFVHLDIGNLGKEMNEWEFFHGDIARWSTIRYGNIPLLKNVAPFLETIRKEGYNKCYYIYHLPGMGGTTLGRQICWELRQEMPVLCLKMINTIQNFNRCLHDIYILFEKNPFLILIDENEFSESERQDLETAVKNSDYRVNALFVQRLSESGVRIHHLRNKKNELVFSYLDPEYKKQLEAKCKEILKGKGQEARYESRKKNMDVNISDKEKVALLVNLYLLEENFNLKNYVKKFLDCIPADSDGERIRDLLVYAAIGEYYANVRFPVSYFSHYLSFSQSPEVINSQKTSTIESFFESYEGLLMKTSRDCKKLYGVKHFLIAKEMLVQLLGGINGELWTGRLLEFSRKLIDMFAGLAAGQSQIDENINNIITALFTNKTRNRVPDQNNEFTGLLNDLDEPQKIDIIMYLADKMGEIIKKNIPINQKRNEYKLLAHIYAQRAKIRSKYHRIEETEMEAETKRQAEIDQWIRETRELIEEENICEYDLEDMLGRCYLERIRSAGLDEQLTEEQKERLLLDVDRAVEHFDYTIWYGSPSYGLPAKIEAIRYGLNILSVWNGWQDTQIMERMNSDEKAQNYIEKGINAIRDIDEYELTIEGRIKSEEQKDYFEKFCYPGEPSKQIQRLENLRNTLPPEDYAGQYRISNQQLLAYERKYAKTEGGYRWSEIIRKALNGDNDAIEDAGKAFECLDRMVKLGNTHDISYTTYNRWFEYAKYKEVSLARAWDVAQEWKRKELNRERRRREYGSSLLRPYYYLFVISLLRYTKNSVITGRDVQKRKEELNTLIKTLHVYSKSVQDWYSNRKELGQLYDHAWIGLKLVDQESRIKEASGIVVAYEENNTGYIRLTNPRRMSTWDKPPMGQIYSKNSDVFFDGRQSGIISTMDINNGKEKRFKFGFSYEKMVVSEISLENRNIKRSVNFPEEMPNESLPNGALEEQNAAKLKEIDIKGDPGQTRNIFKDNPRTESQKEQLILPAISGEFTLKQCKFPTGKIGHIIGVIEYNGQSYPAMLPSVRGKELKRLRGQKDIRVHIKSRSDKYYILQQ